MSQPTLGPPVEDASSSNPLIARLQGLFPAGHGSTSGLSSNSGSSSQSSGFFTPNRPHIVHHSLSEPSPSSPSGSYSNAKTGISNPASKPRKAIKVLIVTWNMADSLPKGDISVLLGPVPAYQPPEKLPESLPSLVEGNAHPYHLVVVAGQECPTPNGMPMGFGGGFMKGIVGRDKEKEREWLKVKQAELPDKEKEIESEMADHTSVQSPAPAHAPQHSLKGWSDILEEYLCGTTNQHYDIKPHYHSHGHTPIDSPSLRATSTPSAVPTLSLGPRPPSFLRSTTAPHLKTPGTTDEQTPSFFPQSTYVSSPRTQSPLGSSASASTVSNTDDKDEDLPTPTPNAQLSDKSLPRPSPPKQSEDKGAKPYQVPPSIVYPDEVEQETGSTGGVKTSRQTGNGPYVFLAKERLLGIYLSVFVYKGCQHLVQGLDKDYVPAGLVGGRVGNKGGIGISVQLAGHRLLFINAHLAAHASRVDARIANIAKIKSELRLNNFLPLDHPKSTAEDLTDRFDTTFWCGDLNFRLDVSRLHADWLVARKEYRQALEFDQLRRLMNTPEENPLPGFVEAPIDFAPTFKYDVWRSLKHTQRKQRRSIRRSQRRNRGASLSEVHEDVAETVLDTAPDTAPDDDDEVDEEEDFHERRSFDSSVYTFGLPSTRETDIEEEDEEDDIDSHPGTPSQTRPITIVAAASAAKAKAKLLNLLKRPTPSPSSGRSAGIQRRVSKSSPSKLSTSPREAGSLEMERPQSASSGKLSVSPPRTGLRRGISSRLKRTLSGKAMPPADAGDDSDSSDEDINQEDTREGVYDSSKKQRVPSWCDRVLWKTFVQDDPSPVEEKDGSDEHKENRLSRIGHAISHAMHGRVRGAQRNSLALDRERSLSRDESQVSPLQVARQSPASTPPKVSSPLHPRSRRGSKSSPSAAPVLDGSPDMLQSPTKRGSLIRNSSLGASPARPIVDREPAQANGPTPSNAEMTHSRRRSNSADVFGVPGDRPPSFRALPSHPPPDGAITEGRVFSGTLPDTLDAGASPQMSPLAHAISEPPPLPAKEQHLIAARRWFSQLPTLLHQRASLLTLDQPLPAASEAPPRRRKGEVECIAYGTIDDKGMRLLEGRSDHRPAIFAANVYI